MKLGPLLALVTCAALAVGCGRSSPSGGGAASGGGAVTPDGAAAVAEATAPLEVITLGAAPAAATATVVLLHGYGAGGDDLVGLARALPVPATVRFVIPAAPLALAAAGTSRAWWRLDGGPRGAAHDRSEEVPAGLAAARAQVDALLDGLEAEGARRIVLGGFSQGAMLTLDVALHRARPLAGLAVLSGTRVNGAAWRAHLDRVRGTPVLISHGTDDAVLAFAVARDLRDELTAAGAAVEWVEFPGGHAIPAETRARLAQLITRVASPP
ncbi:MAG: dienelactone hydrolase family protein [Myxococcales bacterium]|nr:dienelactone hydrolase family protein [Myxococcales bacterium]